MIDSDPSLLRLREDSMRERRSTCTMASPPMGTMRIQRSVRATLATVADVVRAREIAPPAVIVVGAVAGLVDAAAGRVTDG